LILAAREALGLLGAYLLGSLSFAVILVRVFRGKDVREEGSGNAGATNVLRTSGKLLAISTLLLDALKGTAAVLLMRALSPDPRWEGIAAVFALLGHVFPLYFGFRGGKGVATAVGAFVVLAPLAVAALFGVFALVVAVTRYVSLGSIATACLLPLSVSLLARKDPPTIVASAVATAILLVTHRSNIRRLVAGTERKVGTKRGEGE
jgi:glycerol-3-phosphate acyltransferase PlsY